MAKALAHFAGLLLVLRFPFGLKVRGPQIDSLEQEGNFDDGL